MIDSMAITKEQALSTLDQLGTFVMTKKTVPAAQREAYSDAVLRTLSLYRKKAEKADLPSQYSDIVEAAKHELKAVFEKHQG